MRVVILDPHSEQYGRTGEVLTEDAQFPGSVRVALDGEQVEPLLVDISKELTHPL